MNHYIADKHIHEQYAIYSSLLCLISKQQTPRLKLWHGGRDEEFKATEQGSQGLVPERPQILLLWLLAMSLCRARPRGTGRHNNMPA